MSWLALVGADHIRVNGVVSFYIYSMAYRIRMDLFFFKKNLRFGVDFIFTCGYICFLFDVYMFKFVFVTLHI